VIDVTATARDAYPTTRTALPDLLRCERPIERENRPDNAPGEHRSIAEAQQAAGNLCHFDTDPSIGRVIYSTERPAPGQERFVPPPRLRSPRVPPPRDAFHPSRPLSVTPDRRYLLTVPPTHILGISAFYHDSAACLLTDGVPVAAAQEERFSRIKGDASFPRQSIDFCLRHAGIGTNSLSAVAFYDKPFLKFERILETFVGIAPRGFGPFLKAGPAWIGEKLFTDKLLRDGLGGFDGKLLYAEHHESHAASAFFPSPFQEAAIVTVDGVGEWATASIGVGRDATLDLLRELHWPDSLGLLYSAFTYHAGFRVNSGEYKLMGLAPFGEPRYVTTILDEVMDLRDDGSFTLDQSFFNYLGGLTMTSNKFDRSFGGPPRKPESPLTQREMDLARSVQDVCEEVILRIARTAHALTGLDSLCMAGGVALNAVANGRVLREGPFANVWIQPAAGDAGGALGAALLAWHRHNEAPRTADRGDSMRGAALGPSFSPEQVAAELHAEGAVLQLPGEDALPGIVARLLAEERVVGWFEGAMEFGPRALGHRSILADARSPRMQSELNLKTKFREGFRPFAPSVLLENAREYFDIEGESPYMLVVAPLREDRRLPESDGSAWGIDRVKLLRSDIPAVTHVDYSARVQTVTADRNPRFHALLAEFRRITGCAVLINTSFNVRGEPIVCSPADAYRCFMRTNIDYLVVWPYLLDRREQPGRPEDETWRNSIPLD
jgi:carbamoyltransferase